MKHIKYLFLVLIFICLLFPTSCGTENDIDTSDILLKAINNFEYDSYTCEEIKTQEISNPSTGYTLNKITNNYMKQDNSSYLISNINNDKNEYYFEEIDNVLYKYSKNENWTSIRNASIDEFIININNIFMSIYGDEFNKIDNLWEGNVKVIQPKLRFYYIKSHNLKTANIVYKLEYFNIYIENDKITKYELKHNISDLSNGSSMCETISGTYIYNNPTIEVPNGLVSVKDISVIKSALNNLYSDGFTGVETIDYQLIPTLFEGWLYGSVENKIYNNCDKELTLVNYSRNNEFYDEFILYDENIKSYIRDKSSSFTLTSYDQTRTSYRKNMYLLFEIQDGYFLTCNNESYINESLLSELLHNQSIEIFNKYSDALMNSKHETSYELDLFRIELTNDLKYIKSIEYNYVLTIDFPGFDVYKLVVNYKFVIESFGKPNIEWPNI